jgi:hypothetical protein
VKYQKSTAIDIDQQDFEAITTSVIDKDILNAWIECIRLGRKGDLVYEIVSKNSEIFGIEFRYIPQKESDPPELKVAGLTVFGGGKTHVPVLLQQGAVIRRYSSYTQQFSRVDPTKSIEVKLDIEGREGLKVQIEPLKAPAYLPVGTVISSVLPWSQFSASVGENSAYDPYKNSWAPCDQRSIAGSDLARLGGGTHTPDLRGTFLRGLNSFASDEPVAVNDTQMDPDAKRKVGSFQQDSVGSHTHLYRGGGAGGTTSADAGGDRNGLWHDGDAGQGAGRNTENNPSGETRPKNVAVFYYIKIN